MVGNDYANNKLYFQIWIAELQSRLLAHQEYEHITINGVHPGYVASCIWNNVQRQPFTAWVSEQLLQHLAITPQQGSLAIANAAANPELTTGGKYFNRIWEAPPRPECNDLAARSRVWAKVDEELGLRDKRLLTVLGE